MEDSEIKSNAVVGRFAPSPTGRMHVGNVFTALLSWLSVRSRGGEWVLRIEELDRGRSRTEWAQWIEDDLQWLGLVWDRGGIADTTSPGAPFCQSLRSDHYERALGRLAAQGLTYPCTCTRADIMATQAPHESDGRVVYQGTCRPKQGPPFQGSHPWRQGAATRLWVPDSQIVVVDANYGSTAVNLARHCGDFVLRRGDGAWAYQLAVVVDDAEMGVTEVVRGHDLLLSAAQQMYLCELLGYAAPRYMHVPLVCNNAGVRLSKRDSGLDLGALRQRLTAPEIIGALAYMAGLTDTPAPVSARELFGVFRPTPQMHAPTVSVADILLYGHTVDL